MQKKRMVKWVIIAGIALVAAALVLLFAMGGNEAENPTAIQMPENALVAYTLAAQSGYEGNLRQWVDTLSDQTPYEIALGCGYEEGEAAWTDQVSQLASGEATDMSAANFSEEGELVISLSDGTAVNLGTAMGDDQTRVTSARKNEQAQLVVTYADGICVNLGAMVALSGEAISPAQVGISAVTVSEEGKLQLTLTNGTTMDLGSIQGS